MESIVARTGPSAGLQFEEPTPEEAPSTSPDADVANTTDILTNAAKAAGATLPEATEAAMKVATELHTAIGSKSS